MRKLWLIPLAWLIASPAFAQPVTGPTPVGVAGAYNTGTVTCTNTNFCYLQTDANGLLKVAATFTPSGTQNVNLTQILGAAPSLTNPLWVFPATGANFPVTLTAETTKVIGTVNQGTSPWVVSGTVTATSTNPVGITPTDRTITSATGSSQQVMAANASRHSLIIQNTGNANCGINPTGGTAVIGGAGTLTLLPAGSYQPRVPTLSAVTAICTAGQPFYAEEN